MYINLPPPSNHSLRAPLNFNLEFSNILLPPTEPRQIESEYKMVLCVRLDLNMSIGKVAAQCSHATLGIHSNRC